MKTLYTLILVGIVSVGCNNINQNQQEFNIWIKTAQKHVVVKWQNKTRGIQTDDDCLLIDAKNNVLFLRDCDMKLPEIIK
jgi:hypothetical protein